MFRSVFISLLCIAQLSVYATAASSFTGNRCGVTAPPYEDRLKIEQDFSSRRKAVRKGSRQGPIAINVYMHIISQDDTREGGNLPDEMIYDQIDVLNSNFEGTDLVFNLADINRVRNAEWYRKVYIETDENRDMVSSLRVGGVQDLNIFTVGFTERPPNTDPLLGYATFPWEYESNPDIDGVVLDGESMPNGILEGFNEGKTATHEVGHWIGLWHTFQTDDNKERCEPFGNGDFVADTPLQKSPSSGCPIGRDSCPNAKGLDPIHNFMDYSDDSCLFEFTKGQVYRFLDQIDVYRGLF